MDIIDAVRQNYNENAVKEWERLERHPFEFAITCRFLDRYLSPGDRILDIGGGPGRYSLYYAEKGCDVTLFDLSEGNLCLAGEKAAERGLSLRTVLGDAREAASLGESFDHVLLMGPLYHLLDAADRELAVREALSLLKPGGILAASFISAFAGIIYAMKEDPENPLSILPNEIAYEEAVLNGESFAGEAFTYAYFAQMGEILPFFSAFPLEKLHFFGQEGVTAPCEHNLLAASPEAIEAWTDMSERLCEREEYLCFSEHLMYIGRKLG